MEDRRVYLSTAWIFLVLNFVYADVLALFDSSLTTRLSGAALLGASVLVEAPMVMVVFSRVVAFNVNRWTNFVVAFVYTLITVSSQFVLPAMNGTTTSYYLFFGAIEVATTIAIMWYAWTWRQSIPTPQAEVADLREGRGPSGEG